MGPMECIFCGKALPVGSSSRKQFCDDSHRASYWREHSALSPKGKREKNPNGSKEQVGVRRRDKPAGRTPQTPRVRQHTSAHTASRIPMAEQLRGLAPEGAVGYRLVLQTRLHSMTYLVCLRRLMLPAIRATIPSVRFRLLMTFD
jgi:hypothetical protein